MSKRAALADAQEKANPQAEAGTASASAKSEPAAPWLIRTYAGHSSAERSNALFRANLARGQTGLSIAFDLPT